MSMTRVANGILFTVLALSLFLFSGCGGSSAPPSTSSPPTSTSLTTSSTPANVPPTTSSTSTPTSTLNVKVSSSCSLPPAAPSPDSQNQAGDIPDSQVFVSYQSSLGGYQLQVPEGWARTTNGTDARFVSKLDGVQIFTTNASNAPTADSVSTNQAVLAQLGHEVRDVCAQNVQVHGKPAVLIVYTSNSDPNPVTGKQVRLENNAYLFFHAGKLATLTLWAPLGSDNVDQWRFMSGSFKWV
jgi:hypothetical protein